MDLYEKVGLLRECVQDYDGALAAQRESLALAREYGDLDGESRALILTGNTFFAKGEHNNAISFYHKALGIAQKAGNRSQQAKAHGNLAAAFTLQHDYSAALDASEAALTIARELGQHQLEVCKTST